MKRTVGPLTAGRLRLRLIEPRDLPMTLAWRNADRVRPWFFSSDIVTPEQHRAWFEQYRERDDDFVFVIEETETLGRPVGQASIYHVDWTAGRAEFGRLMIGDDEAIGQGLARQATARLAEEALTAWGLREVYLECRDTNAPALAAYTACGFHVTDRRDGVVRMHRTAGPRQRG